ncbi:MAG TPA: TIGR01777 family oxidoreductase [Candidatus Dormibacteraeota bacterium]|nr:TIGR01777 family oxidoreductase [Candidatus Dormibacteraeota bacterium]
MRIVLAGGTGQVGTLLARHFQERSHEVVVIARSVRPAPWRVVQWDGATLGDWTADLERADVLMNLVGRSVNCRYTAANRRAIKESRVQSTRLLGQAIARLASPPRLWMNASTATIYRHALDRAMDEDTGEIGGNERDCPSSWRFSIDVATSWEEAFFSAVTPQTRKIALRSAVTLSPDRGGIFAELLWMVRLGAGGTAGSGDQFVSWIHGTDFIRAVEFLVDHEEIDGIVNVAAPGPLPNRDFMRALREAWGTWVGVPAPALVLALAAVFLRTETELILKSRRVVPGRLLRAGFEFQFPKWPEAAKDLVTQWRERT